MAQTIQYYPVHAFSREHMRHPEELRNLDHTPVLPNYEVMPDCDARIFPPPRHPGRLAKSDRAIMDRPRPKPVPRAQVKPVAEINEAECEAEDDHVNPLMSDRPSTPHRKRQHPPRMKGSNSSLGNPRWSSFPIPPNELPQQPPPNRPLPQLPPTPTRSTRSRQSSGASKRSFNRDQQFASPPVGHPGPNVFPPSPPQDLQATSPIRATFGPSILHERSSSQSSNTSSSNRPNSLTTFPTYGSSTLPYHPVATVVDHGPMAPVPERTFEDDVTLKRLISVSARSGNSEEKHSSSSGRRMSSSTNSSEGPSKSKKSGMLGGKGLKGLIKGKTPQLIEVVKANDLKALLNLLAPGVKPPDINCTDRDNRTALHWAADLGYYDIADVLLARNAITEARTKSQGRTPLYLAAAHGHTPVVTLLLEHGAAVSAASKMDGATAIHKAAQHGYTEVITALVAAKADVNKKDVEGMPALMWACQRKQLHAAHKLVAAGADLEIRIKLGANLENSTYEGMTVLHRVARTGDVAFARLFLEHGADPDADAPQGFRALHNAASKGDLAMVECLVEFGADVNLRSSEGWAPLHFAARHGHRKVALFLIRQGADPNMRTGKVGSGIKGDTPAELARKHGFEDVA